MAGEPAVKFPGSLRGASEFLPERPSDDLQAISHAREQAIEHVVAQTPPPREVLTDAGLAYPADPRQLGLGDAGLRHHLSQDLTARGHNRTIAKITIAEL
jgi:hypothetical protein